MGTCLAGSLCVRDVLGLKTGLSGFPNATRQTPDEGRMCVCVCERVTVEWTETVKSAHSALDIFAKRILNSAPAG